VPGWLQAIKGKSMALGLDLQGGVHFLLEVDDKAALEKRSEGYLDSIRSVLRENQMPFVPPRASATASSCSCATPADLARARTRIAGASPELPDRARRSRPDVLLVTIPPSVIKQISDDAIEQNMDHDPQPHQRPRRAVVQRQGAGRIVVEIRACRTPPRPRS
jgi:preprotein translocase subunit SecD